MKRVFFENLDFLRFVAFFLVFAQHSMLRDTLLGVITNSYLQAAIKLLGNGGIGVSFFFVLSGYLITYLLLNEQAAKGQFSFKNFYIRRTLRIWPLYFSVVLFGFFVYPYLKTWIGMSTNIPAQLGYYVAFLANFDIINIHQHLQEGNMPMMLGLTWSVAIEEQFYLVFPILLLLVPNKYYGFLFGILLVFCGIFRHYYQTDETILYFHTFAVMGDLIIGALLAYYSFYSTSFVSIVQKLSKNTLFFVYLMGFALLLYGNYHFSDQQSLITYRIPYTLFFAFVIAEQNFAQNSIIKYHRFKTISNWGQYTYGLYLLHPIAIQVLIIAYRVLHLNNTTLIENIFYVVGSFALSLIMSYLSYHYFESYFLRLKKRFTNN